VPAGPHDFGKVDRVAVESPKMMIVRNHHITAVAQKINYPPIFGSGEMMGLEEHRGLMPPIITAEMNIRHQIEKQEVGQIFRVEIVNSARDQILHPGVPAFWVADDEDIGGIGPLNGSEPGLALNFSIETILQKPCRRSKDRLNDFRNRSFHGVRDERIVDLKREVVIFCQGKTVWKRRLLFRLAANLTKGFFQRANIVWFEESLPDIRT
jgi:hypothetical protein